MIKMLSTAGAAFLGVAAIIQPAQAALTPDGAAGVAYYEELEARMQAVLDVLTQVKSKETADTLAPVFAEKMKALQEQLDAAEKLSNTLTGIPNDDDLAAFEQHRIILQEKGIAIQQELMRLGMMNFYESKDFIHTLNIKTPATGADTAEP